MVLINTHYHFTSPTRWPLLRLRLDSIRCMYLLVAYVLIPQACDPPWQLDEAKFRGSLTADPSTACVPAIMLGCSSVRLAQYLE